MSTGLMYMPCGPAFRVALVSERGAEEGSQGDVCVCVCVWSRAALMAAVASLESWFDAAEASPPLGYICLKPPVQKEGKGDAAPALEVYEEYCPFVLAQHRRLEARELPTFDAALAEFYSKVSSPFVPCRLPSLPLLRRLPSAEPAVECATLIQFHSAWPSHVTLWYPTSLLSSF
jgi:hypothetical protein